MKFVKFNSENDNHIKMCEDEQHILFIDPNNSSVRHGVLKKEVYNNDYIDTKIIVINNNDHNFDAYYKPETISTYNIMFSLIEIETE